MRRILTVVATFSVGLGVSGTALAASGPITGPADTVNTGAGVCPKGKVATAGGYRGADGYTEIYGMAPQRRRFQVALWSSSAQNATALARCAPKNRFRLVRKTFEWEVTGGGIETVYRRMRVRCPRGTRLAAGGMRKASPDLRFNLIESAPISRRVWRVYFYTYSSLVIPTPPGTYKFKAVALCDKRGGRYIRKTSKIAPNARTAARDRRRGGSAPFQFRARCPRGTRLSAGGFRVDASNPLNVVFWKLAPRSRVFQLNGSGSGESDERITAMALCRR